MIEALEVIGAVSVLLWLIWVLVMIVFILASIVFWIWMLIDAIKNQKEDKVLWILLIFSLVSFGAAIYFLVARKGRKKEGK